MCTGWFPLEFFQYLLSNYYAVGPGTDGVIKKSVNLCVLTIWEWGEEMEGVWVWGGKEQRPYIIWYADRANISNIPKEETLTPTMRKFQINIFANGEVHKYLRQYVLKSS